MSESQETSTAAWSADIQLVARCCLATGLCNAAEQKAFHLAVETASEMVAADAHLDDNKELVSDWRRKQLPKLRRRKQFRDVGETVSSLLGVGIGEVAESTELVNGLSVTLQAVLSKLEESVQSSDEVGVETQHLQAGEDTRPVSRRPKGGGHGLDRGQRQKDLSTLSSIQDLTNEEIAELLRKRLGDDRVAELQQELHAQLSKEAAAKKGPPEDLVASTKAAFAKCMSDSIADEATRRKVYDIIGAAPLKRMTDPNNNPRLASLQKFAKAAGRRPHLKFGDETVHIGGEKGGERLSKFLRKSLNKAEISFYSAGLAMGKTPDIAATYVSKRLADPFNPQLHTLVDFAYALGLTLKIYLA